MVLEANDSCPRDRLLNAHYVPHTVLAAVVTEENMIKKKLLAPTEFKANEKTDKKSKQKLTSDNNILLKRTREAFRMRRSMGDEKDSIHAKTVLCTESVWLFCLNLCGAL